MDVPPAQYIGAVHGTLNRVLLNQYTSTDAVLIAFNEIADYYGVARIKLSEVIGQVMANEPYTMLPDFVEEAREQLAAHRVVVSPIEGPMRPRERDTWTVGGSFGNHVRSAAHKIRNARHATS